MAIPENTSGNNPTPSSAATKGSDTHNVQSETGAEEADASQNGNFNKERSYCDKIIAGYARLVVRFPWLIILVVVVITSIMAGVTFTQVDLPDFEDPIKGFEARGTYIKGAELSHEHLTTQLSNVAQGPDFRKKRQSFNESESSGICFYVDTLDKDAVEHNYVKFVFVGQEGKNDDMFTREAMTEICDYEQEVIMTSQNYNNYGGGDTCRGLSIGHFAGLLAGQKDCSELTENDVSTVLELIQLCAPLIKSAYEDVGTEECNVKINGQNLIYIITQFLADSEFLQNGKTKVTYSMLMLPDYSFNTLEFYRENVEKDPFSGTYVKLVAFGSDIKYELFNIYVTEDLYLFIIAAVSVLLIMVLYLRSFAVTVATLFDIAFSFILSYFLYHIVFRFSFFPFMNLLSCLVLIAVSADDVFVFTDIWLQEKAHYKTAHSVEEFQINDLCHVLIKTFKHASLSIFVTSLSTASAFLANMVSEITSVKCFGLFSALCIISNFVFMITWVPAVIVLMDKVNQSICRSLSSYGCYKEWEKRFEKLERFLSKANAAVYERFFPFVIAKLWLLWIILSTVLGIGGFIVIFGVPKLSLPTSEEFQFFASSNPLEMYDIKVKPKFHFFNEDPQSSDGIRVAYVFGVIREDNGDHYDPDSTGSLTLDPDVMFSDPDVIDFLTTFCSDVLKAPFVSNYTKNYGVCSLSRLKAVVELSCSDINPFKNPCCDQTWPLSAEKFDICSSLFIGQSSLFNLIGIPYIDSSESKIKAFTIDFASNQVWTSSYNTMEDVFDQTKAFIDDHIANAPDSLQNGFVDFYGTLDFYDLQKALSQGSYIAIGISLVCALLVMLISTLNVLISLYAILTITLAISVTIGVLVLLGWELNILESVTITLAVGLSIDFTIHYGVAYMISKSYKRSERVHTAFKTVGSAVFMAALTTFVAGAAIVSSRVLSYSRLGTFLMLVMTFSWVYATFFFQSLCHICGPEGRFMQIPNPFRCLARKGDSKSPDGVHKPENKSTKYDPASSVSVPKNGLSNESGTDGLDNPAYIAEKSLEVQPKSDSVDGYHDVVMVTKEEKETFTSHL